MKKTLLAIVIGAALAGNSYGQGFLEFRNYNGSFSFMAPIYVDTVGGTLVPQTTVAELWVGPAGASNWSQLSAAINSSTSTPITALVNSFGTQGLFNLGSVVGVSGTTVGNTYSFGVKASDAGLNKSGQSPNFVQVTVVGSTDPNFKDLTGLQSFAITAIPEPSTVFLGVMGGLALLLRRRK